MLILNFHIAFFLGLIALSLGAAVVIFAKLNANLKTALIKFIGWVVIILAAIHIIGLCYYGYKFWNTGFFDRPFPMMFQGREQMQMPMQPGYMMQGIMQQNKK